MVANHEQQARLSPKAATSTLSRSINLGDAQKHGVKKKGRFAESVLSSGKKAATSAQTYNQARLAGVYRAPDTLTASYQPKAMLSTPLNNRKFDKTVVAANGSSATYKKRDLYNRAMSSSTPGKKSAAKSLIQRKHAQSEDTLPEEVRVDEQTQPVAT